MPPPRVVVVVNYGGGIPHALHANVLARHTWAAHSAAGLLLESTDSQTQVDTALRDVWPALRAAGWRSAWFGAEGPQRTPAARHVGGLPSARAARADVDVCSLMTSFDGPGVEHDALVVDEADRHLDVCDRDTLVVLNLRGCADVVRCRFGAAQGTAETACCVLEPAAQFDARAVPSTVAVCVGGVSEELAREDRRRFGEDEDAWRTTEAQYAALLQASRAMLDESDLLVRPFLERARARGHTVAVAASCALPLGEYGVRAPDAPLRPCATSFFVSSIPSTERATWGDTLRCFLASACDVRLSYRADVPSPHVCATKHSVPFLRVTVTHQSRTYTLVSRDGRLLCAFDEHEHDDVLSTLPHLASSFQDTIHRETPGRLGRIPTRSTPLSTTPRAPAPAPRPAPLPAPLPAPTPLPPPASPPLPAPTPRPLPSPAPAPLPTAEPASAPLSARRGAQRTATVRAREGLLNQRHR